MLKSKTSEKGFTIVELLIVIVVIGILAALVLNTFSGVQKRARDTTRQTNLNAVSTQLEVYYNDKGSYPAPATNSTAGLLNDTWVTANLKGLDLKALRAPGATANSFQGTASTNKDQFGYVALPSGCTSPTDNAGASVATATPCTSFTLSWWSEDKNAVQTKASLNN